jgi:flagellar P-ring protein precursor FlgI
VKDLGRFRGTRGNALVGYGIVTGLAGTGDSPTNRTTRQTIANVLSQFDLSVPPEQIQSRNVAVVLVSSTLPAFAREGDTIDVTVTSAGDARSLAGGALLLTPLKAPNGRVYALAQGPLTVGGWRYDARGNLVQKNHPTAAAIPNGATVERAVEAPVVGPNHRLTFVLGQPDYTTAERIAEAFSGTVGPGAAQALDASAVEVQVPEEQRERVVALVARLESLSVEPDQRARVVVNERTGTVVAGGDVRIGKVAISHGELRVSIVEDVSVSQPVNAWGAPTGVRTAIVSNSRVEASEQGGPAFLEPTSNTVADLVQALARLKTGSRDIIAILQAIKAAGALQAELVVR